MADAANAAEHERKLQPDENEHDTVQQEVQRIPDGCILQPRLRAEHLGAFVTQIKPADHSSQWPGDMHTLRQQIRDIGRHQAERDLDRRIGQTQLQPMDQPRCDKTNDQTASDQREQSHQTPAEAGLLPADHQACRKLQR